MGIETLAIVPCILPDSAIPGILPAFLEHAQKELEDFRDWQRAIWVKRGADYGDRKIDGHWCLEDGFQETLAPREGEVVFELQISVHGHVGRRTARLWTSMRDYTFNTDPPSQQLLRKLVRRFAEVVGGNQVVYVWDSGGPNEDGSPGFSHPETMAADGATFEEIVAFARSQAPLLPMPPLAGLDLYKAYPDAAWTYFVDDFSDPTVWHQ